MNLGASFATQFAQDEKRAGANASPTMQIALKQKENRVMHERRWTRSSSWCTPDDSNV